jgi:hypothetical protein
MRIGDDHSQAIIDSNRVALKFAELLPDTDLIIEIKGILLTQTDILDCMENGKHYGTDALKNFSQYCEHTISEMVEMTKDRI